LLQFQADSGVWSAVAEMTQRKVTSAHPKDAAIHDLKSATFRA